MPFYYVSLNRLFKILIVATSIIFTFYTFTNATSENNYYSIEFPQYNTYRKSRKMPFPLLRVNMDRKWKYRKSLNKESFKSESETDVEETVPFFNNTMPRFNINKPAPKLFDEDKSSVSRSIPIRRIVGGMKTLISRYPYNIAIAKHGKHWCGGSLIDEQWIVTAGHCLEASIDQGTGMFLVRAGSSFHSRSGHLAHINKVFFPEEYVQGDADYDMSLARLDRPLPIGKKIAVVNLPAREYTIKIGDILTVTGWGSTVASGSGHIRDRLRFVPVPALSMAKCQDSYSFPLTTRMICAGYDTGGMDACNHDSGGPAVKDGVLLGIVSFGGKKCGDPQSPGVYTRVSQLTDWIEETITSNEAYEVPELIPRIKIARLREKELRAFQKKVLNKNNEIKLWFNNSLKSKQFRNYDN